MQRLVEAAVKAVPEKFSCVGISNVIDVTHFKEAVKEVGKPARSLTRCA